MTLNDIRDDVLYPATVLREFIADGKGRPTSLTVIHRWRDCGKIRMRRIGSRWMVSGAEIRRLVTEGPAAPDGVDGAGGATDGGHAAAELKALRAMGLDV